MKYKAEKVVAIALSQVGYQEKETNAHLDYDSLNAGDENYTKYARDLDKINFYNGKKNGFAWCDVFVDWCFVTAYGERAALKLTFQPGFSLLNRGAGCRYSFGYYQDRKRIFSDPEMGDQVFFYAEDGTSICHTGLVWAVDERYIHTVEGNTSEESGVVANGGAVCKKKYLLTDKRLAGYGRPQYTE
jgi:hypothetical protein